MPRVFSVENPQGTPAGITNSRRRRRAGKSLVSSKKSKEAPQVAAVESTAQEKEEDFNKHDATNNNNNNKNEHTTITPDVSQKTKPNDKDDDIMRIDDLSKHQTNDHEPLSLMSSPPPPLTEASVQRRAQRQALGIDTRVLLKDNQDDGSSDLENICSDDAKEEKMTRHLYKQLLRDLGSVGALPHIISFTSKSEPSNGIILETEVIQDASNLESSSLSIRPAIFQFHGGNPTSAELPKACLPKNTWKLLRGLVDAICNEDEGIKKASLQPLSVTLLVHASCLVIGEESVHTDGLGRFVDHLRGYFDRAKIQSVQMVVVQNILELESFQSSSLYSALGKTVCQKQSAAATTHEGGLPLSFSMQYIGDGTSGFKQLARQLTSRSLGGTRLTTRLAIDLPETVEDGMQCQLLLEAEYHLLATTVQNPIMWRQLSSDLLALSSGGSLRTLQLIPFSALDASLLFGVPLRLSTSTNTSDLEDFQTMQVLFCSVLRLLQEREMALLLQVPPTSKTTGGTLLGRPGQNLVLMVRETRSTVATPQTALLWGYATGTQLLHGDEKLTNTHPSLDEETIGQLNNYVDTALDQIVCGPYNPLVDDSSDLMNAVALTQHVATQEDSMEMDTSDQ